MAVKCKNASGYRSRSAEEEVPHLKDKHGGGAQRSPIYSARDGHRIAANCSSPVRNDLHRSLCKGSARSIPIAASYDRHIDSRKPRVSPPYAPPSRGVKRKASQVQCDDPVLSDVTRKIRRLV